MQPSDLTGSRVLLAIIPRDDAYVTYFALGTAVSRDELVSFAPDNGLEHFILDAFDVEHNVFATSTLRKFLASAKLVGQLPEMLNQARWCLCSVKPNANDLPSWLVAWPSPFIALAIRNQREVVLLEPCDDAFIALQEQILDVGPCVSVLIAPGYGDADVESWWDRAVQLDAVKGRCSVRMYDPTRPGTWVQFVFSAKASIEEAESLAALFITDGMVSEVELSLRAGPPPQR